MTTGTVAATTHPNWKRVSKRANAWPWLALGASRCTMLSNANRPSAAPKLTTTASAMPASLPPTIAPTTPATVGNTRATTIMLSSCSDERRRGPMALPAIVPSDDSPTASPNHHVGASCVRNENAKWNNTNPTQHRSNSIATAAICRLVDDSSMRWRCDAGPAATTSRGRRVAATSATAKSSAPYPSVAALPNATWRRAAGNTAATPEIPAISPSFEFASTSSRSVRTTLGTRADFDTLYVFCSTSAANTSGNNASSSAKRIISSCNTMRDAATA